jgi:alpha-1,3-rhamnosyltransferase
MRVTIIIPSYNHRRYVGQAITSVLDQTGPEVDLIVIDDASTDGSAEVIRAMHAERGGFRFIERRGNKGLISSLNEGLALATGDYFCELASDDYLPPDSLAARADYLAAHADHVALFADALLVNGERATDCRVLDEKRRTLFGQADPLPLMLQGVLPIFATGMFRTEVLRTIGGFDPRYRCYEDLEMPVLLWLAGRVGFLDQPVLCRREHGANVSATTAAIRTDKILCYEKLLQHPGLASYRPLIRYRLRRSYLALGRHLSGNGGGHHYERAILRNGWDYAWQDMRLLWHMLKWSRKEKR